MSRDSVEQPPFGELFWSDRHRWWERAKFPIPMFGSEVELYIPVSRLSLDVAPVPAACIAAGEAMLMLQRSDLATITPHVWSNYLDSVEDQASGACVVETPVDVWRFVQPVSVTLERHGANAFVILECDCGWDMENGLQLVLKDGSRWVRVSAYDGHLTDGQALLKLELDAWMLDSEATLPVRQRRNMTATQPPRS